MNKGILYITLTLTLVASHLSSADPGQKEINGMVLIPEGAFIMGASEKHGLIGIDVGVDALPEHTVRLKAFYIDKYEVTNAQYKEFMAATDRPAMNLWGPEWADEYPPMRDKDPASDLTWHDANEYCKWAGKRLATEEEWEKAARGTDGRKFPWGDEWKKDMANTAEYSTARQILGDEKYTHTVAETGTFRGDVSPYGVYDMAGNVMEWTSSWYKPYPGSDLKRDTFGEKLRVMRGGSWMTDALPFSFTFNRHMSLPDAEDPHFGTRCAKDAE
ncbi:MAG: SUMF1/EgtB/PvdO family nonheme iron enzyme [Deltaproteobacteria bacterium]|nr:SUMF1/EgtB/PvdO family nonheme iron enzyme [Deltaproteobacteria bacterium]